MFDLFNKISNALIGSVMELAYGFEHLPLLFALFLGLVGAVAPCQLTGNVSAITIYGNRSLTQNVPWLHVTMFIVGKLVAFSGLGLFIWWLGQDIYQQLTLMLPSLRKAIGPLLIVIGLFMVGLLKMKWSWSIGRLNVKRFNDSSIGSFLLGFTITLAFCPTMFMLFMFTLMPVVIVSPYGAVLPAIFGIGTSLPLLIVIFLIWYFGASGVILKRSRKVGAIVQRVAGVVLILIGVLDTMTYWN
ncbi:sulfite exporter TauE/SafE family protein [Lentibacillus saliphilus]|uniref:sulfite exporter TauE/SafE family protein n=1 Tax=Lentibacillus saliphilus TaxID=2737028 RepID=UPI001C2F77E5|nr:sulfite exporter TauE/SafE family protein [Lentibacillus saliphilus]